MSTNAPSIQIEGLGDLALADRARSPLGDLQDEARSIVYRVATALGLHAPILDHDDCELFNWAASQDLTTLDEENAVNCVNSMRRIVVRSNTAVLAAEYREEPAVINEAFKMCKAIAMFTRTLDYRAQKEPLIKFPDPCDMYQKPYKNSRIAQSSRVIAARLLWLEKKKANDEEPYLEANILTRYDPLELFNPLNDVNGQRYLNLDDTYTPLECDMFKRLVSSTTLARKVHQDPISLTYRIPQGVIDYCRSHGSRTHELRDYATPCTDEARSLAKPDSRCYVCHFSYGAEYSDELMTEPAVKTACGHIIGEVCLGEWVMDGNSTCPYCRTVLFSEEQGGNLANWPERTRLKWTEYVSAFEEFGVYDAQIDWYLLEYQPAITHDKEFLDLLYHLSSLAKRYEDAKEALREEQYFLHGMPPPSSSYVSFN
ncbi:hypothetical protein BDV95DRAFT_623551 [Massariosphaeria phaeospora]|uniref:RING-type domain-containing protein n=1 Tax=Massariosphaeria phaeospora TaxID=100035 RepID=A0A7C8HZ45_9PLEO|nr:hypothetical protein BDV95DRAFT_623551 [Massariosphaeria phaeospora]